MATGPSAPAAGESGYFKFGRRRRESPDSSLNNNYLNSSRRRRQIKSINVLSLFFYGFIFLSISFTIYLIMKNHSKVGKRPGRPTFRTPAVFRFHKYLDVRRQKTGLRRPLQKSTP